MSTLLISLYSLLYTIVLVGFNLLWFLGLVKLAPSVLSLIISI
jgi:hypothetical protein